MDRGQSGEAQSALDVEKDIASTPVVKGQGVKLYKYVKAGETGEWELVTSNARPCFYDALEDTGSAGKKQDWFLEIEGSDIDVHVDMATSFVISMSEKRVTFNAGGAVYAMRVQDEVLLKSFAVELSDKQFYNTYGMENDKAGRTKGLGDYADRLFNIDNVKGSSDPMDIDNEGDLYETPGKFKEQSAFHEEEEDDPIMGVIMGANDNSYLLKGGAKFDVLRNVAGGVEDRQLTFTLTPAKGSKTPSFETPSRVLLTQGERRMHLLTPENRHKLHHADVETGKIVNTFSFQKNHVEIPIIEITHDTKSSQMEETSTFLGLNDNEIFRWDLRDPHGKVAESPVVNYLDGRPYSKGTNFTCMATSGDGYVVVGSQDGQIRLYSSKSLTRANTAIPGMGAPITSIDVTYDGKWIVATTYHFLMVVKTTFQNGKGAVSNGFTSRMGSRGAMPRLLRLKPEDVARTGGKPLVKGKFSWITESGHSERWIVVSCGKYSVVWNFQKVKSSSTDNISFGGLPTNMDYIIAAKEEEVVDAAFQHRRYLQEEADTSIVVATQHSLFSMN